MYFISETTASPPETNATFWQDTNGNLRPSAESPRTLLSSSSSKRKILIAVLVAASVFLIVLFGIGFYLYRRKMELPKEAKYGLVNSPKPNEIAVKYRAHDASAGGSLSSCESTAPLMRQPSLRSRLSCNLTQVSEEDMPLEEKWEIDRAYQPAGSSWRGRFWQSYEGRGGRNAQYALQIKCSGENA